MILNFLFSFNLAEFNYLLLFYLHSESLLLALSASIDRCCSYVNCVISHMTSVLSQMTSVLDVYTFASS